MRQKRWVYLALVLAGAGHVEAVTAPMAVSPGQADEIVPIASRCPTFSWSAADGAEAYDLVVYKIRAESDQSELVFERQFRGAVDGWTPSLDRCLDRGGQYAWSVRAVGLDEASDWSQPRLFRVSDGLTVKEFQEALLVVGRYLQTRAVETITPSGRENRPTEESLEVTVDRRRDAALLVGTQPGGPSGASQPSASSAYGTAAVTVAGEVRTVDSSKAPRLWGRGRPGTDIYLSDLYPPDPPTLCSNGSVRFGLSAVAVDWGSAADACPGGSWVCTAAERGSSPCDTLRDDWEADGFTCAGDFINLPEDNHIGWLADGYILHYGSVKSETETSEDLRPTCQTFPVWCCLD